MKPTFTKRDLAGILSAVVGASLHATGGLQTDAAFDERRRLEKDAEFAYRGALARLDFLARLWDGYAEGDRHFAEDPDRPGFYPRSAELRDRFARTAKEHARKAAGFRRLHDKLKAAGRLPEGVL